MNHFARFGLEPRPWIDQEFLKEKFLNLSAGAHPDKATAPEKVSSEREFQGLNESYNVLRNTRARLLHLLELNGARAQEHVQAVPPSALEFFTSIASIIKRADALIREKSTIQSPMVRVQFMDKALEQVEEMQHLQEKLRKKILWIDGDLEAATNRWVTPLPAEVLAGLSEYSATLGFLERWNAQLQERIGALTF
jgi:DnaJ-domain-containing protein 1